jgi:LmbE family N-acetylglucosaminyl deacetylase
MEAEGDVMSDPTVNQVSRSEPLRMLCILAHPDDESLGLGGVLARYGAEGVETYVVTATRGEKGWSGPPEQCPGAQELGQIRERELRAAAEILGVRQVTLLDYHDGDVSKADQTVLIRQLVHHIRRIRPDVVVTFDQAGIYGHPDHIAVTRAATAAVVSAASASHDGVASAPHAVSKLYYFAWTQPVRELYERAFGELVMEIDGSERRAVPWPDWAVSTRVDTSAHWNTVWAAVQCHRSQLPTYQRLLDLPPDDHQSLWGRLTFYRTYSLVPSCDQEDDLFAGLRRTP